MSDYSGRKASNGGTLVAAERPWPSHVESDLQGEPFGSHRANPQEGLRQMATSPLEFVHWRSADANGATGGLDSVRLAGPMGTAFFLKDDYPGFGSTVFNPPLAATGMVEIASAAGHEFEVKFGVPLKDPVFYLGSLASTLAFPQGTQVTRVSGDSEFKVVEGNKVRGKPFQPPPGSTALSDSNGIVRLTGTFTSVKFTLTPNPGSTFSSEGVFLQIGGTPLTT